MLSTTTTALSTSMPTASSRPIIDRMLSVTPAKYMKPSVITKQIGIASVTISVDGQWRRKKNSTAIDSSRPMPPASASSSSELVTFSPWLSMHLDLDVAQLRAACRIASTSSSALRDDLDQVGVALLEDVEADRGPAVEAAAVVDARRLQAHVGDVAQAQAVGVDHQVAQLAAGRCISPTGCTRRRRPPSSICAGRDREVDRLQPRGEVVEAEVVRGQAIGIDRDLDLVRRRAGDLDARHARDALDAPLELAVDQVVRAGQVAARWPGAPAGPARRVVENFSTK